MTTPQQPQPMPIPLEPLVAVTAAQRNSFLDELAKAQVIIDSLAAENEQLRADLAQARDQQPQAAPVTPATDPS